MISFLLLAAITATPVPVGEQPVDPYVQSNANAGTTPLAGTGMWHAFHEQAGVDRIVDDMVDRAVADPVIGEVLAGQDIIRLRRLLKEQFCYILNGGCTYSGRDMKSAHRDLGVQAKDMNVLVTLLQQAMGKEKISFFAQNRFLSKLAPMRPDVVTR